MKRVLITFCLSILSIFFISCSKTEDGIQDKQIPQESPEKTQNNSTPRNYHFSNVDTLLKEFTFDFGMEDYYRITDYKLTDVSCSYFINENGFLVFSRNGQETVFLDSNLFEIVDENCVQRNYLLNERELKEVSSDGYLTEVLDGVVVEYKVGNLMQAVISGFEREDVPKYTNPVPFAAKRGNSGIGEKIILKCTSPHKSIKILPGYVSTIRQDLYYKNNRPSKIKIQDLNSDYCLTVELSDIAVFQEIPLSFYIKDFEIEIIDVYKGTKYDDTCISGLLLN